MPENNKKQSLTGHCLVTLNKKNNSTEFNFVNEGFNLRPLEVSAAIGLNQFRRLKKLKNIRKKNRNNLIKSITSSKKWDNQFSFFKPRKSLDPSWFGFPLMINKNKNFKKKRFLRYLNNNRIENRRE